MDRKALIDKLTSQLKQWEAEIEQLEAKAKKADADVKAKFQQQIEILHEKRQEAHDRLEELKQGGEEARETLQSGVEEAFDALKNAFHTAKSKFNGNRNYKRKEYLMNDFPLLNAFANHWWVLLLRGIAAVLFGFLAFVWPGLTLVVLVFLFGAYALVDGVTALFVGGRARAWWMVFAGVLGIIAGVLTFIFPGITAFWLLILIASWAIVRGIFEIVAAIQLRKELTNEWMLIIGGAFSIIFGVLLFLNPAAGALAVVWLIGAYAAAFGIMMIVLAFRLRGLRQPKL